MDSDAQTSTAPLTLPSPDHESSVNQPVLLPSSSHVSRININAQDLDSVVRKRSTRSAVTQGLHARTLKQQVQSCFTNIVPIALNIKGNLTTTFGTPGMIILHETCVDALRAADISFENAIFVCNTMRRLKAHLGQNANRSFNMMSQHELTHLRRIVIQLRDTAEDARRRLWDVNRRQHLLLSSPKEFMPSDEQQVTNFPLPKDLEEGGVTLRIIKLIKAQMTYMVGKDKITDVFEDLEYFVSHSGTTYYDQRGITTRIRGLVRRLTELGNLMEENKPPHTWTQTILALYERAFSYVAQIPSVNDLVPKDPEMMFLKATRAAITKLRNAWFTVNSVDELMDKPLHKWRPDDLDSGSRAILSRRNTLPGSSSSSSSTWNVDLIAMITRVHKLPNGHYGLSINVKCCLSNPFPLQLDDSPGIRCNKLDIVLNLRQSPSTVSTKGDSGLRLRITHHHPSQVFYNKTDRKYGIKGNSKVSANSAAVKGELGFEVSREIAVSNYSVMESHQTKDDCVHWRLCRNQDSSAGISDCEVGVVVDAPAAEIEVEVRIKAYFSMEGRFKMFSFLTGKNMSLNVCSDPTVINVEEALAMELSTSQGVEDFLAGCNLTKPS